MRPALQAGKIRSLLLLLILAPAPAAAQDLRAPDGWIARPERFVEMPPGWHITSGRGVILYHPRATAAGSFQLGSEGYLFDPEGRDGRYGLILGGRDLDSDAQRYVAFEIGPHGDYAVRREAAYESTDLASGTNEAILRWTGEEATVRNVLAVDAGASTVRFLVNERTVAELPRSEVDPDGIVGFRVDAGMNLHITTLDVTSGGGTRNWAPVPPDEDR
jgi:hypothetical protein